MATPAKRTGTKHLNPILDTMLLLLGYVRLQLIGRSAYGYYKITTGIVECQRDQRGQSYEASLCVLCYT